MTLAVSYQSALRTCPYTFTPSKSPPKSMHHQPLDSKREWALFCGEQHYTMVNGLPQCSYEDAMNIAHIQRCLDLAKQGNPPAATMTQDEEDSSSSKGLCRALSSVSLEDAGEPIDPMTLDLAPPPRLSRQVNLPWSSSPSY